MQEKVWLSGIRNVIFGDTTAKAPLGYAFSEPVIGEILQIQWWRKNCAFFAAEQ